MMSVLGGDVSAFMQRYGVLKQHQDTSDALIKDLVLYCQGLESSFHSETTRLHRELSDAKLDLSDATKSRRDLQQKVQANEDELQRLTRENDNLKNRNPYVAVLIDGDGLLFKSTYVKQGLEGGKRAASILRAAIASQCGSLAKEVEVVAKVYANLSGLNRTMRNYGSVDNENDLKDFALGFTQSRASFDFIDVGFGKERADSKIRENANWHLKNVNCKMVALGISHDTGYAPFLDEILSDNETHRRISIIEGFPTVRELASTGVNIINMNDSIFRPDKLGPNNAAHETAASVAGYAASNGTSTTTTNGDQDTPSGSSPQTSYASATSRGASPAPNVSLPAFSVKNVQQSQAAKALKRTQPNWNPGPRGLDPAIVPTQTLYTVIASIKQRRDGDKLCNLHVLRGYCAKGAMCNFNHKHTATPDEKKALAYLARLNPCSSGQDCDLDDCIYGHHCPSIRNGVCQQLYCKFDEDAHPPGTEYKH